MSIVLCYNLIKTPETSNQSQFSNFLKTRVYPQKHPRSRFWGSNQHFGPFGVIWPKVEFWPFLTFLYRNTKDFQNWPILQGTPLGSQKSRFRRKLSSHSDALFQLFFEPLRSLGPDLLRFCLSSLNSSLMPDLSYPRNRKNRLFQHFCQKWVSIWILPYNTVGGSRGRFDPQNRFLRWF